MRSLFAIVLAALCVATFAHADEGMWTFDNPPLAKWKKTYDFEPDAAWFDHVRLSSVRFNDGGSGSFVSPNGLVMTNHHVASGQIQKLSSEGKDLLNDGFLARTPEEELSCADLELNVLVSMEDVTARVRGAVSTEVSDDESNRQRKAAIARIEKESLDATGLRSDVVTLYAGGEYWLYRYKKYTDIRLVFAPEQQAAYFGGDPDNFSYPRHDLDCAFVRVWENGKPLENDHWFRWSREGAATGDLVIVSGNPGGTDRMRTLAELDYQRDVYLPSVLDLLRHRLAALREFSATGEEQARRARDRIFGYENAWKALSGEYEGLLDPKLMDKKRQEELDLRDRVKRDSDLRSDVGNAWDEIAAAVRLQSELADRNMFRSLRASRLCRLATTIVQYVEEVEKPNGERYEEFRDTALESLHVTLFSAAPIYKDYEAAFLAAILEQSVERLGKDDAAVAAALDGRSPKQAAGAMISGTALDDPEVRRKLVEGGKAAVKSSTDPLIVMARAIDPHTRELRKINEDGIEGVVARAGEKIAKARFAAYGKTVPPDATFTLRLSYGPVGGYEQLGTRVPHLTTFHGLFDRAAGFDHEPPYDLTARFVERKSAIDLSTPLNFVCSADIIGGNSGSPVINTDAEIVGLIFDGNIQSLTANYLYDDATHRAVSVHSAGILEALRRVYDADALANEIQGVRIPATRP